MTNLPMHAQNVWKPATESEKAAALVSLSTLPSRATSSEGIDRAAYYIALDGVTRHGLSEAVKFILKGALGHAFFPSPPELRMQCDRAMEWHEQEQTRIRRRQQIEADRPTARPEPTADQKRRVQEAYRQFLASYEGQNEEAAERAEVRARYGMTPEILDAMRDQPVPSNFRRPA